MLSGSLPLGSSERQVEFESGEYQDNVASRPNQKKQKQKVKSRYQIRKRNRNIVKSIQDQKEQPKIRLWAANISDISDS